jgi:hypothetical protein
VPEQCCGVCLSTAFFGRIGIMVARLNDLPAAPAFEDAASALTPGGVRWPPYGVQKVLVVGGRADARPFRVVRADRRSGCGNCGNRCRPHRSPPGNVCWPPYGVQKVPVVGGRAGARSFRAVRADRRSACGNCGNRIRQRRSHPIAFQGLHTVRRIRGRRPARRRHPVFVFSALIGETLAGNAEIRAVCRSSETVVGPGR